MRGRINLNQNLEIVEQRLSFVAGTMMLLSIALFASAGVLLMAQSAKWLIIGIFTMGGFLFCVNVMVPGILLLLRRPNLAYAWLRGRNPLMYAHVHWEELSANKRRSIYVDSVMALVFVIAYFVWLIREWQ